MKFKLFNLLTVCLATSGLLAPAQAASSHSEELQYLVCVKKAQHLLCDVETSGEHNSLRDSLAVRELAVPNPVTVKETKATTVVPPLLTPAQQGSIANILLWIGYLLPCGLGLGIFLYDKYCVYRSAVLNQQIETLESLWQYGSDREQGEQGEKRSRGSKPHG